MRKIVFALGLAVLGLTLVVLTAAGGSLFDVARSDAIVSAPEGNITLAAGSEAAFRYLSQQRTNICGLQPEAVLAYSDDMPLQGSCCAPIELHRYQEQVEGLLQYANIAQIPADPYDIPASLAKELLGYQVSIQLNAEQQVVYDEAVALSDEGGPCCCRCWRWYAFEGMDKYLITQQGWSAEQLGELWSLTDGCGGAGHTHA
ncbi:MAG: hypothetical protein IT320_00265 [Anaerolineae bacterium]|nr:hypothetical protein [Anaerolineae bacterium]